MYPWYKSEEDRRQLVTAIYLYVYLNRKKEEFLSAQAGSNTVTAFFSGSFFDVSSSSATFNRILEEGGCCINGREKHPRNVCICYSGGDDLFIVGAWNEVVELSVDVRRAFARYTQGTLSLSAGIGLYEHDYPVSAAAREVAELEDTSKKLPEKNAVTKLPAILLTFIPGIHFLRKDTVRFPLFCLSFPAGFQARQDI